jgi:hypothetical protein
MDGHSLTMELWLMDLSSLRFSWGVRGSSLTVLSARREALGVIKVEKSVTLEEAATQGFDAALGRGRVERVSAEAGRGQFPICLYNPFTAEVALGALPKTRVFTDRSPLSIEPDGQLARLDESGLWVEGRCLNEVVADLNSLSRSIATYEDLVTA